MYEYQTEKGVFVVPSSPSKKQLLMTYYHLTIKRRDSNFYYHSFRFSIDGIIIQSNFPLITNERTLLSISSLLGSVVENLNSEFLPYLRYPNRYM